MKADFENSYVCSTKLKNISNSGDGWSEQNYGGNSQAYFAVDSGYPPGANTDSGYPPGASTGSYPQTGMPRESRFASYGVGK